MNRIEEIEDLLFDFLLKIRMAEELLEKDVKDICALYTNIYEKYKNSVEIPISLVGYLSLLLSNGAGSLEYYNLRENEKKLLSGFLEETRIFIEELFLGSIDNTLDPDKWIKCSKVSQFERIKEGIVYCTVKSIEDLKSDLFAKQPGNIKTIISHITCRYNGSQYISATKDVEIAKRWAKNNRSIIEINLINVPNGAIDISSDIGLNLLGNNLARSLASKMKEVLFDSPIPFDAIKPLS